MRLRVRHVFDFGPAGAAIGGDLLSPAGWDAARDIRGPFGLPSSRDEWLALGAHDANVERAAELAAILRQTRAAAVCSHGVGTGLLEQQLARLAPDLRLICTDFAPRAVARLAELFPEAEVIMHDLAREPLPEADVHVMHRVDTELSDAEWRGVFERAHAPIVFIPAVLIDLRGALREVARRLRHRGATAAGWFRNEEALRDLWGTHFDDRPVSVGGLRGFVLEPR